MEKKPRKQKADKATAEEIRAAEILWFQEHKDFVEWWKNHRDSGFCFRKDHLGREVYRWGIHPVVAWNIPANKVGYHDTLGQKIPETEQFSDFIRLKWRKDQARNERLSAKLGTTFDAEHNKKVYETIQSEYGNLNAIRKAWEEDGTLELSLGNWTAEAMHAKLDKAYEYEPGQSEEETEALRRRR